MDRTTKIKEAIKTGLAFALVFGLAMQFGWMNPYWAGWAVAVISLPTAGESLRKGVLRVLGTIPGCIAALIINALAPQERRPLAAHVWLGFPCLLLDGEQQEILLRVGDGSLRLPNHPRIQCGSSGNMFESAVFRTVETVMGVVVYTLISVFLWPRTNLGAIQRSSADLAGALNDLYHGGRDRMLHPKATAVDLPGLQAKLLQQLARFGKALQAEGSESYEVGKDRHLWGRFQKLGTAFSQTVARWQSGLAEVERLEFPRFSPHCQPSSPNSMLVWLSWPQCSPASPWFTSRARSAWSLKPSRWDACRVLIAPRWRSPERSWRNLKRSRRHCWNARSNWQATRPPPHSRSRFRFPAGRGGPPCCPSRTRRKFAAPPM